MQDRDETFPAATTWVTELASNYGVTGKVWDCPTTSFKGTEAAPDYFFVGGSFLSNAALGDIKDPTAAPMLADLASPKDNKPYIQDNGGTDFSIAASTVDKARHNNGVNFTYTDGHVAWMAKDAITPFTFLPSAIDRGGVTVPSFMGTLFKNVLCRAGTDLLRPYFEKYGTFVALGRYDNSSLTNTAFVRSNGLGRYPLNGSREFAATPDYSWSAGAAPPSWWKVGVGGSYFGTAVGTATGASGYFDWAPAAIWSDLCNEETGAGTYAVILNIKPNTSTSTAKLIGFGCTSNHTANGYSRVQISSLKYYDMTSGALTATFSLPDKVAEEYSAGWRAAGGLFMIPVPKNQRIEMTMTYSGTCNPGYFMVIED
ncbi:MAG: H-X9-DG-CTERM domain-containing protein [Armatimonadota bacterium]